MQPVFDVKVEEAIKIIWTDMDLEKSRQAFETLKAAADAGDGDACYFTARCYAGRYFVNPAFMFEESDDIAEEYLNKSIESGSAVGMFGGRRFGGFKPRAGSFVQPPFHSDKEIWDAVANLAAQGQVFCKLLIANAYYYGDPIDFWGIDLNAMNADQYEAMRRDWCMKACQVYEECIQDGMMMGLGNYVDIVSSGDYGIPKDEVKKTQLFCYGAEKGLPDFEVRYGKICEKTDPQRALMYYERAINHHYNGGYYNKGRMYTYKGCMPMDLNKAVACFEKCFDDPNYDVGCHNMLGEIYFRGGNGIQPDYAKAFQLLLFAHEHENDYFSDLLGTCYLMGLGTAPDYIKAKQLFEIYPGEELSAIGLGDIYAFGLGVPEDIAKGMEFWNKFPGNPRVIQNKQNFKKKLFGWKRIN
ncbi:MAG: tetratricopeptide repeat protein [Agathobacter sp.]